MLSAQQFQHLNQQYQQQGYCGGVGGVGGLGTGFCVGGSGAGGIGSAVMYGFNLGAPGRSLVHGCVISLSNPTKSIFLYTTEISER